MFKFRAIRFTTHKEAHYFAIDHADVFQIKDDVATVRMEFKKPPQFVYRMAFDSTTYGEHRESPSRRSLDPKSHRSRHIAVAMVLQCSALSEHRSVVVHPNAHSESRENKALRGN